MGRQVRDARLETRDARLKLKQRHEPYWRLIHEGLHLGYRKGPRGAVWLVRYREGDKYLKKVLGHADDDLDSNDDGILSYRQAQTQAIAASTTSRQPSPVTVSEAATQYLDWYKENRKAFAETEKTVRAHILPAFGETLIGDLTTRDIKAWHQKLATVARRRRTRIGKRQQFGEKPKTSDEKRARKSTANRILTVLKAMLNKAFEDELVRDDLAWRRVRPFDNVDEPVIRFLTIAEATRLINSCSADFRQLAMAAVFTGARYGELASLKVGSFGDTGTLYLQPSKSGKGRHVPLNAEGLAFFTQVTAGRPSADLVFTKADGNHWGKNHHVRALQDACKRAKIDPAIGFHELRHTYASLLAQAGVDLLTISKLLGHSDTRITARHYAHLTDKTLADAVNVHLPSFGQTESNIAPLKPKTKIAS